MRKQKKIGIYRSLFDLFVQERFVYIIIHLHLGFQFDRINSLSGNFYLSSLVDFSALWTNISAGVTTIYNKSSFQFNLVPRGLVGFENENTLGTSLQIFRQMVSINRIISLHQISGFYHLMKTKTTRFEELIPCIIRQQQQTKGKIVSEQ